MITRGPSWYGCQLLGGWKPKQAGLTSGTIVKGMRLSGRSTQQTHPSYFNSTHKKYSFVQFLPWQAGYIPAIRNWSSGEIFFCTPFFFLNSCTSYLILFNATSITRSQPPSPAAGPSTFCSTRVFFTVSWWWPCLSLSFCSTKRLTSVTLSWH